MAAMTEAKEQPGDTTMSLRVFVVENHADTREFLTFMLEELGHPSSVADTMGRRYAKCPRRTAMS